MKEIAVRSRTFTLCEDKALFWPDKSLLIISDLHLGKAESFQQNGMLLPSQANTEDLNRLERLVNELDANRLLILGDFVHTAKGISGELKVETANWIQRLSRGSKNFDCKVVIGNHDHRISKQWPKEWEKIQLVDNWCEEEFIFTHEPTLSADERFVWSGHIHPMFTMSFGPDRLRLPCFVISDLQGLLPAFSSLAGGHTIRRAQKDRIFPIADSTVLEI